MEEEGEKEEGEPTEELSLMRPPSTGVEADEEPPDPWMAANAAIENRTASGAPAITTSPTQRIRPPVELPQVIHATPSFHTAAETGSCETQKWLVSPSFAGCLWGQGAAVSCSSEIVKGPRNPGSWSLGAQATYLPVEVKSCGMHGCQNIPCF